MPAAMPCKIPIMSSGETHRNIGKRKTKYACVVDADESTRPRLERAGHKPHQDHITAKGMNSMTHYSLVHKFIPMPQALKIPDAKAAVEREWAKLEKIPAWQLTKVWNKSEVIAEARKNGKIVHFASLMDLCHLKTSELEPQFHKYKGRVVLRGDIVKDDSGSCAVFTEQGSSASQMTAAKEMDIISTLPGCSGQAAGAISAYTQVKMEDAPTLFETSKVRMSRYLDTSTKAQIAKIMFQCGRFSCPSRKESVRSSSGRTIMGKAVWESSTGTRLVKSLKLGMFICQPSKRTVSISVCGRYKLAGKTENIEPTWNILMKDVDLGEPISFLDHV